MQLANAARERAGLPTALIIRHAERPRFAANATASLMDAVSITENGYSAAQHLGIRLMWARRVVYTSPVLRCRQTAEALGAGGPHDLATLGTVDVLVPALIQDHFDRHVAEACQAGEGAEEGLWIYVTHDRVISLLVDAALGRVPDLENCYPIPFLGGLVLRPTAES